MTQQTWFITGSSRGFGRALTLAALEAGDRVVATARRPEQLSDLVEQFGDNVLPVALDVTDSAQAVAAIDAAVEKFGRVDVVVNNAGYANIAPVETAPEDDFRQQFDTNFWGVYHVSKAALPVLKKQGAGLIIQFSSLGGRVGSTPGLGAYQAAKFAVDGLTRVLAAETAPLGLKYLVVEPGGFATDWAGSSMDIQAIPEEYQATVGAVAGIMGSPITQAGDPQRAGETLVRVAKLAEIPSHFVLGADAAQYAIDYSLSQIAEASRWKVASASLDFGQPYPVRLPGENA
ncbi:SDR family NAD(P)-dependent oxidoreductase [Nocardia vaccinii]|uniref:SDR family NAD(P)-dependent oxidoreductase n=1 Tax=Nocardia vaccinii TaxID=1822 RepID=UPI00082DBB16|nr:SDR family NAD(P)-dependent oxidoreductase [Nocardia vaccinii]